MFGTLVQLGEHIFCKDGVIGSSPICSTYILLKNKHCMDVKFRYVNRTHGDSAEQLYHELFEGSKNSLNSYKFAEQILKPSPISSSGRATVLQTVGRMFKSFIGHDAKSIYN